MPYKIIIDGVPIEAESSADALALAEMIAQVKAKAKAAAEPKPPAAQPRSRVVWPTPNATTVQPPKHEPIAPPATPAPVAAQPKPAGTGRNGAPIGARSEAVLTVHALSAIQQGGVSGTASTTLQPIVGGELIAVGSKMRPVKRVIQNLGFENPEDVYRQERVDNRSVWFPGPKIEEAVQKAKEKAGMD